MSQTRGGCPGNGSVGGKQAVPACQDADPDLFFPDEPGHLAVRRVAAAKRICAECAVRVRCLDDSLSRREPYGVWGGVDERERAALLAAASASARTAASA